MHIRKHSLTLILSASCSLVLILLALAHLFPLDGGIARAATPCSSTYWNSVLSGSDSDQDALSQNNRVAVTVYGKYDSRTGAFCGSYYLASTITITHTLAPGNLLNNWLDLQLAVDGKGVTASANEPGPGTYTLQTHPVSGTCVTTAMGFLYLLIANAGTVCSSG